MKRMFNMTLVFLLALLATVPVVGQTAKVEANLCAGKTPAQLIGDDAEVSEFTFELADTGEKIESGKTFEQPVKLFVRSSNRFALESVRMPSCDGRSVVPEFPPASETFRSVQLGQDDSEELVKSICDVVEVDGREVYDLRVFLPLGSLRGLKALGTCNQFTGQNMANYVSRVDKNGFLPADAQPDPVGSAKLFSEYEAKKANQVAKAVTPVVTSTVGSAELSGKIQVLQQQIATANSTIASKDSQIASMNNQSVADKKAADKRIVELQKEVTKLRQQQAGKSGSNNSADLTAALKRATDAEATRDAAIGDKQDAVGELAIAELEIKRLKDAAQLPGGSSSGRSGSAPNGADQAALEQKLQGEIKQYQEVQALVNSLPFWKKGVVTYKLVPTKRSIDAGSSVMGELSISQVFDQTATPQKICSGEKDIYAVAQKESFNKGFCSLVAEKTTLAEMSVRWDWNAVTVMGVFVLGLLGVLVLYTRGLNQFSAAIQQMMSTKEADDKLIAELKTERDHVNGQLSHAMNLPPVGTLQAVTGASLPVHRTPTQIIPGLAQQPTTTQTSATPTTTQTSATPTTTQTSATPTTTQTSATPTTTQTSARAFRSNGTSGALALAPQQVQNPMLVALEELVAGKHRVVILVAKPTQEWQDTINSLGLKVLPVTSQGVTEWEVTRIK